MKSNNTVQIKLILCTSFTFFVTTYEFAASFRKIMPRLLTYLLQVDAASLAGREPKSRLHAASAPPIFTTSSTVLRETHPVASMPRLSCKSNLNLLFCAYFQLKCILGQLMGPYTLHIQSVASFVMFCEKKILLYC